MIDINQVQRDFDNGVMLCRETIRQVIELAAEQVAMEIACGDMRVMVKGGSLKENTDMADMILNCAARKPWQCTSEWKLYADTFNVDPETIDYDGDKWTYFVAGINAGRKDSSCG